MLIQGASSQSALLSPGLSSLELDSSTSMSLPSPTSCSLDGTGSLSPPPSGDISSIPSLQVRVGVIKRRVSKQFDFGPEHSLFVFHGVLENSKFFLVKLTKSCWKSSIFISLVEMHVYKFVSFKSKQWSIDISKCWLCLKPIIPYGIWK